MKMRIVSWKDRDKSFLLIIAVRREQPKFFFFSMSNVDTNVYKVSANLLNGKAYFILLALNLGKL